MHTIQLKHTLVLLVLTALMAKAFPAEPAAEPVLPVLQGPVIPITLNGRATEVEVEDLRNPVILLQTTRGDMVLELFPAEAPVTVANFLGLAEGSKPFTDLRTGQQMQRPFYDGLLFHRVIKDFMIQGGSPDGQNGGTPGFLFNDEINAVSLGLDRIPALNEEGYPNPLLGISKQEDFQNKILIPLYRTMGILNAESLEDRAGDVDQHLRSMSLSDVYELQGYHYMQRYQSRALVKGVIAMANSGPDSNGSQFFITLADTPWLNGKNTVFGKVRAGIEVLESIGRVPVDGVKRPLETVTILLIRRINV